MKNELVLTISNRSLSFFTSVEILISIRRRVRYLIKWNMSISVTPSTYRRESSRRPSKVGMPLVSLPKWIRLGLQ